MIRNKIGILAAVLCAFLGAKGLLADQLVTNGGFETGDFTGFTLTGFATSFGGPPAQYGVDASDADSGNYGAYLASEVGPLTLAQNLTVVPGNSYTVSFSLADRGLGPTAALPNSFLVTLAGQTVYSQANTPDTAYTNYSFLVTIPTAGSTTASLDIISVNDAGYFALDNVSVSTATPEPATFLLIAPVLGGLALLRRKRS